MILDRQIMQLTMCQAIDNDNKVGAHSVFTQLIKKEKGKGVNNVISYQETKY